jgi:hypothetical protein
MFGISCNFANLQHTFSACPTCLKRATAYLDSAKFALPLQLSCSTYYGFSLSQLIRKSSYATTNNLQLSVNTPGFCLIRTPGMLTFQLLADAWHFTVQCFVHDKNWLKEDVKAYFTRLCINTATTDHFIRLCCNYLLVKSLDKSPEKYDDEMIVYVTKDRTSHPHLYQIPTSPASWKMVGLTRGSKPLCIWS